MRSVYVNNVNILQRLHRQFTATAIATHESISDSSYMSTDRDDMRVFYGDVGSPQQPNFGCHNLALSAVRLTRPGALIQLPHQSISDSFNFRMSFSTVKPDGVLVSTRVEDTSTRRGVLRVSGFSVVVFLKIVDPEVFVYALFATIDFLGNGFTLLVWLAFRL